MVVKVHLLLHVAEEIPVEELGLPDGLENALFSQIWNRGAEKKNPRMVIYLTECLNWA